jgi:hypothetical protein
MKSAVYNAMADLKNARKEDNQSHGKKIGKFRDIYDKLPLTSTEQGTATDPAEHYQPTTKKEHTTQTKVQNESI